MMPKAFRKIHEKNNKSGNNSLFDLSHHGDEILTTFEDDRIHVAIKVQTGRDTYQSTLMSFDNQTQFERLFPTIVKGLKYARQ